MALVPLPRTTVLAALTLAACVGNINGPLASGAGPDVDVASPTPKPEEPIVCTSTLPLLPRRIVRLDAHTYRTTVQSLYNWRGQYDSNVYVDPPLPFTRPNPGDPFTTYAASYTVGEYDLEELELAARTVSEHSLGLLGRTPADSCMLTRPADPSCQRSTLAYFIEKLFNRPVTSADLDEGASDLALHQAAGATPIKAVELVLRSYLMSPQLVFREELGDASGLNSIERAKLLSYTLIGVPPDARLWELGKTGQLMDEAKLRDEARRLMSNPKTLGSLRRFLREYFQWESVLKVNKDDPVGFHKPSLLVNDVEATVEHQLSLHARSGLLRALLTSEQVHVGEHTGGSWKTAGGTGITTVTGRPGLLTQPAWLAGFSEPTQNNLVGRGRFIRERLLCTPVPQIPAGVATTVPSQPGMTYRARVEQLTAGASCSGCHKWMNGLGGAFEGFDHFGRPQTTDNGAPVVTSGVLDGAGPQDTPFADPAGLMRALADSAVVHDCFLTNLFSFYVGRPPTREDQCELERIKALYRASGEDVMAVIEELLVWQATTGRSEVQP